MLASVCPAVFCTCASCQSYWHEVPEQVTSAVDGRYQKVSVVVPVGGMDTVCDTELSPPGVGVGCTIPSSAEPVPEWTWALLAVGVTVPAVVQDVRPFSN